MSEQILSNRFSSDILDAELEDGRVNMRREIVVHTGDTAKFRNLTDYCVGTGRVDLA